ELGGVHESRNDNAPGMPPRKADERQMAFMQPAHCRHQRNAVAAPAPMLNDLANLVGIAGDWKLRTHAGNAQDHSGTLASYPQKTMRRKEGFTDIRRKARLNHSGSALADDGNESLAAGL